MIILRKRGRGTRRRKEKLDDWISKKKGDQSKRSSDNPI